MWNPLNKRSGGAEPETDPESGTATPRNGLSTTETKADENEHKPKTHTRDLVFLPIPKHLQYDPAKPPHFGIVLNATFGFASTFSECESNVTRTSV
jgi:hypothetical protein